MLPLLKPGDVLLINPSAYLVHKPQVNDLVLAKHPWQAEVVMVKRVQLVVEGHYDLIGDNPEQSTDSRHFGPVADKDILGQVTCFFSKKTF